MSKKVKDGISNPREKLVKNNEYYINNTINQISEQIKKRRKELGLSKNKISDLTNIAESTVYNIENYEADFRLSKILIVLNLLGLKLELIELPRKDENEKTWK